MSEDRLSIEDALYRRAGQLAAHFGRYDMYALTLENVLHGAVPRDTSQRCDSVASRGHTILRLLKDFGHSEAHQLQFLRLDEEFHSVLARNQIRASNGAVLPSASARVDDMSMVTPIRRDWFDHDDASDEEILVFIVQMEKDIVSVASLYLRVAAFVTQISALRSAGTQTV
jgi:hypothetical protein